MTRAASKKPTGKPSKRAKARNLSPLELVRQELEQKEGELSRLRDERELKRTELELQNRDIQIKHRNSNLALAGAFLTLMGLAVSGFTESRNRAMAEERRQRTEQQRFESQIILDGLKIEGSQEDIAAHFLFLARLNLSGDEFNTKLLRIAEAPENLPVINSKSLLEKIFEYDEAKLSELLFTLSMDYDLSGVTKDSDASDFQRARDSVRSVLEIVRKISDERNLMNRSYINTLYVFGMEPTEKLDGYIEVSKLVFEAIVNSIEVFCDSPTIAYDEFLDLRSSLIESCESHARRLEPLGSR